MSIKTRKSRKDLGLLIALLAVALAFTVSLIPIVISLAGTGRYKAFVKRFTEGINSSHVSGKVMLQKDGEMIKMPVGNASKVYSVLIGAGMGKEQKEQPGGEPLAIIFDDGSMVEFWESKIKEKNSLRETGLFVRYTASDGYLYQYDTDKLTLDSIFAQLPKS